MRQFLAIVLVGLSAATGVFGNIAMPQQPPSPAGDVLGPAAGLDSLRIEREDLRLDLTGGPDARSLARYAVVNPLGSILTSDLYFVTPYLSDLVVTVDGKRVAVEIQKLMRDQVPWKSTDGEYRWWPRGAAIDAYRFQVEFAAGRTTVIEIVFRLPAGYDNTLASTGIAPAAAAHALNWSKPGDHVAWFIYSLESAETFKGGFGVLHAELVTPAGTELVANLDFPEKKTDHGLTIYTGEFQGLPVPSVEARVISRSEYNMFGATASFGLTSDFGAYTSFLCQALLDVYFLNHQISTGVEGNPFGSLASLKIPVLYTFIFGGRMNPYLAFFGDLRLSAGALIDLLPASAFGFRMGVGARFTLFLIELAYDFYPFDVARGYLGRFTFLGKLSI